ncbi:lysophospholipid acyltransferase family protein [Deinococcus petrolearius]|uniref:Lysophospholipid acyltransferase family protein n=1 Tax=Deinococcus petrolearius TaxID=1751295 RepID=A0ABW1DM19_9DEIO
MAEAALPHGLRWDWAEAAVRRSVRAGVRRELAGVYLRGPWPAGGAVLAPNHHSWWDGYVLRELAWAAGQPCRIMMTERQLARFPFLRRVGAIGTGELRSAVRAARAGAWVVVFPEGDIRPAGPPGHLQPGAAWLARQAGVPLVPVALRLALRGAERPEAFVRFGGPAGAAELSAALARHLAALDADLRAADPDGPPAGYLRAVRGRASTHDAPGLAARMLTRLTEPAGRVRR